MLCFISRSVLRTQRNNVTNGTVRGIRTDVKIDCGFNQMYWFDVVVSAPVSRGATHNGSYIVKNKANQIAEKRKIDHYKVLANNNDFNLDCFIPVAMESSGKLGKLFGKFIKDLKQNNILRDNVLKQQKDYSNLIELYLKFMRRSILKKNSEMVAMFEKNLQLIPRINL